MGGLTSLGDTLANLAKRAGVAADEMARATDAAGRLPKDLPGESPSATATRGGAIIEDALPPQVAALVRSYLASGRKVGPAEETIAEIADDQQEILDALKALREGADVGELVPNQRDLIEQIQGTVVGRYLDKYAELLLEKLTKGFALSPARNAVISEALPIARDIIQRFAGPAGARFNFSQFEQDLKRLLEDQRRATESLTNSVRSGSGGTSGARGSATGGISLSVLRYAGAVR